MAPLLLCVEAGDVERAVRNVVPVGRVSDPNIPGHTEFGQTPSDGPVGVGHDLALGWFGEHLSKVPHVDRDFAGFAREDVLFDPRPRVADCDAAATGLAAHRLIRHRSVPFVWGVDRAVVKSDLTALPLPSKILEHCQSETGAGGRCYHANDPKGLVFNE